MHPNQDVILNENIKSLAGMEEVSRKMLAGESGVAVYIYKGVAKICGYAQVPLSGWSLAVTQNEEEFMASVDSIELGILIIIGIAVVCAVFIILFFSRSVTIPIIQVAEGLRQASAQVASASTEVAGSSQLLAEGASEQAASLEETSSSLEELASMTQQNTENAQQADQLSQQANNIVDRAGAVMSEFNQSMEEISQATQETAGIIKTIDEIAFQTNLLALNAAVEAARAGDAGAGFAVVAEEVRNLAMRSAEAAKQTASLIESTVDKVKVGSGLVTKSDQAFKEVAQSTHKVNQLMAEIAVASKEQAEGINQINLAMGEMDKATQNSAASAEETASASEELNGQSESLLEYVDSLVSVVQGAKNVAAASGTSSLKSTGKNPLLAKSTGNSHVIGFGKNKFKKATEPLEDDFKDF